MITKENSCMLEMKKEEQKLLLQKLLFGAPYFMEGETWTLAKKENARLEAVKIEKDVDEEKLV